MAHHDSNAKRALADFNVFDEAIGKADSMTSPDDTLIVVTADHSHM
jgi:alkaline phosphatase